MKKHLLLAAISLLSLNACSIAGIRKHEPNFKSTREIAKAKGSYTIGEITATDERLSKILAGSALPCRITTFNMPVDTSVSAYLKNAFTDELDAAEKLSKDGKSIDVLVKTLDSTAGLDKGNWKLDFDYKVGGKTYNVQTVTNFESAFVADTACRNTANAFTDAVGENFVTFFKKLPR